MPLPAITIRAATGGDIPAIAHLLTQLNHAEGRAEAIDAATLAAALGAGGTVALAALVAEVGGDVQGAVLYYPGYDVLTAAYGYHLSDIVVDAAARRRGVGKQLFHALARRNLDAGGEWISLTVLRANRSACAFYDAMGMMAVPVEFYAAGKTMLESALLLQN